MLTIEKIKKELKGEKKKIEDWLALNSETPDLDNYDFYERAEVVTKHTKEVDKKRAELKDFEDALARIEDGTYGYCSNCHQKIPEARLDSNKPRSLTFKRCYPCQSNHSMEVSKRENARPKVDSSYRQLGKKGEALAS